MVFSVNCFHPSLILTTKLRESWVRRLHSGRLALLRNIRPECRNLAGTNALAYHAAVKITVVKCFTAQAVMAKGDVLFVSFTLLSNKLERFSRNVANTLV